MPPKKKLTITLEKETHERINAIHKRYSTTDAAVIKAFLHRFCNYVERNGFTAFELTQPDSPNAQNN